jgi:hypothetical protein
MTDNDFNAIPAVENLQNVAGLTPTGQRQERKRRQGPPRRDQEPGRTPPDKAAAERDDDSHRIDYRA